MIRALTSVRCAVKHNGNKKCITNRWLTSSSSSSSKSNIKHAKTRAGSGNIDSADGGVKDGVHMSMIPRGPVSWAGLGLVAVAAASAVSYYKIERERRLENAMGKIVSSESGWSPNPEFFAKRKFKKTKYGWFPEEDAFGGGTLVHSCKTRTSPYFYVFSFVFTIVW